MDCRGSSWFNSEILTESGWFVMDNVLPERVLNQGNLVLDDEWATYGWLGEQAPDLIGDLTDWENGVG